MSRGVDDEGSGEIGLETAVLKGSARARLFGEDGAPRLGVYSVDRRVGAGGMGVVFQGRDEAGNKVALKVVRTDAATTRASERFRREVAVLSKLEHPAVVRYLDHGEASSGEAYLAMEWLEGRDLAQHLRDGPLALAETLALGRRLAGALQVAHEAGVIHRDLKPSNVLVPEAGVAEARLIDFGIAQISGATKGLTGTGGVVGTPGYMSPEQARGERDLDARSDVYALGCVLFECLSGKAPFRGEHVMAVLAKILLEDTPRLSAELAVPPALDDLIARMMTRERSGRPGSARDVEAALAAIDPAATPTKLDTARATTLTAHAPPLGDREQVFVSILFLRPTTAAAAETVTPETEDRETAVVSEVATAFGGRAIRLMDGSMVITIAGTGEPKDQAAAAARCALALKAAVAPCPMALVTGRGVVSGDSVLGQILDRGAEVLEDGSPGTVRVDESTARLLDESFRMEAADGHTTLIGPRRAPRGARTLLGRPTPFVGRARELAAIEASIAESANESVTNAVIVLADPGVGKSRLRHEVLLRLGARHDDALVLIGRSDVASADAPYAPLARAFRTAAGIQSGEPRADQADKLGLWLARVVPTDSLPRVAAFLGEMTGVQSAVANPALEAARHDPALMRDAVQAAFEAWLTAEASNHPVVLVLEDLHWADVGTVQLLDRALRSQPDLPLFVLALARPELDDRFENAWDHEYVQRIALGPLGTRAARKLVLEMAGARLNAAAIDQVVERSGGNAFYLEELIRTAVSGHDDGFPDTVLGMAQARLARLDSENRRMLRAASVIGETFWARGVEALLGATDCTAHLDQLAEREYLSRRETSGVPGTTEYTFRHALVRDAAYTMLTPEDRIRAHALAGEWLEGTGAAEAAALADHYRIGENLVKARQWFERAARIALESDDLASALRYADAGIEAGPDDDVQRGRFAAIRTEVYQWNGRYSEAIEHGKMAQRLLQAGSSEWYRVGFHLAEAMGRKGEFEQVERWVQDTLAVTPAADATMERHAALAMGIFHWGKGGKTHEALAAGASLVPEGATLSPRAEMAVLQMHADGADLRGNSWAGLQHALRVLELARPIGSRARIGESYGSLCHYYAQLGANDLAREAGLIARDTGEAYGLGHTSYTFNAMLGGLAFREGNLDEAERLLERAESFDVPDPRMRGTVACVLGLLWRARGDLDRAEHLVRRGEELLRAARPLHPMGLASLAQIKRIRGDTDGALELARRAIAIVDEIGGASDFEVDVHVALLECLKDTGFIDEARREATRFKARLDQRTDWIEDPTFQNTFHTGVPANVRLLELAKEFEEGQ